MRPSLSIQFGNHPLYTRFAPVFRKFFEGAKANSRDATEGFLNNTPADVAPVLERDPDGSIHGGISVAFLDGSGYRWTVGKEPDGKVSFAFSFLASSDEAMSAFLDMAASGFTEMDSQSLAAGLSK